MRDQKFYRTFKNIAIPVMIQYFITSSINLMDNFMVGKLGEESIAAMGVANQYFFLFNILLMGIYSGCNVIIAQLWGNKDLKSIKKTLGISLVLGMGTSLVFFLGARLFTSEIMMMFNKNAQVVSLGSDYLKIVSFSYIIMAISYAYGIGSRSVGSPKLPVFCSGIALAANIILNYVFIFGKLGFPAMGVSGAALATLLARILEMSLILILVYQKEHVLSSNIKELANFDEKFFKKVSIATIPVVVNELCWGLGAVVYTMIYGNMGVGAFAAVQISFAINGMFFIVLFAVASAACVMVGNQIGKGDIELAKYYGEKLLKMGLKISVVIGILLALSAKLVLMIYNITPEVYTSAYYILIITAVMLPIKYLNIIFIVGILRGGGDASYVLKIELATMWLIGVPICYIGAKYLGVPVYVVVLLVNVEDIIKVVFCYRRYKSGKWIRNLASEDAA